MDQTAVQTISLAAERLLSRGDRETIRQAIAEMERLLARGPAPEQGGPTGTDPEVLAAALKIKMRAARENHSTGTAVARTLCSNYREQFIQGVNDLCGGTLTREEEAHVASKFDIVLSYWLRTAAETVQRDAKNYHDLEALGD